MAAERAPIHDSMIPAEQTGLQPITPSIAGEGRNKDVLLRAWVSDVREMDFTNTEELQRFVELLNSPDNKPHFAGPPASVEELSEMALNRSHHFLSATNSFGEVIGGMLIEDAPPGQHDHWLRLAVVDPELQSPAPGIGYGVGKAMLRKGIDWAATTPTYYGRRRYKLDASVIMGVKGWIKMQHILMRKLAFQVRMILPNQVDFENPKTGITSRKSTKRFELNLDMWRSLRELEPPVEKPQVSVGK